MRMMFGLGLSPRLEEGVVVELERGPLSSSVVTSYRLPIVTLGLPLVLDLSRTDRQTE